MRGRAIREWNAYCATAPNDTAMFLLMASHARSEQEV